jgi:hypothetical protein
MNKQSRGGRGGQDKIDEEFPETERTQKDAIGGDSARSGDTGSFGAGRGDAYIDRDLEEIEEQDDSLLAGGRQDVQSQPRQSGKSAPGGKDKSSR